MISYSSHKVMLCRKIQIGDYKGKRISGLEGNIIMLQWLKTQDMLYSLVHNIGIYIEKHNSLAMFKKEFPVREKRL